MAKKKFLTVFFVIAISMGLPGAALAKSLYVISDLYRSRIRAYEIQGSTLVFQAETTVPYWGGGPVGIAIDTDSEILFITYEVSNVIQLVDATTFEDLGTTTAPGASNLAGIVVDEEEVQVYAVDRGTPNLYAYDWYSDTRTLVLENTYTLTGTAAWGIALDEEDDLLYVANNSTQIRYYNTSDWSLAGTMTVGHTAIGIAVDSQRGFVYSGGGWGYNYYLTQYDLNASTQTSVYLANGEGIMGVAVDPDTGLVYCTTGYSGDQIRVFDTSLTEVHQTGPIGSAPTGLVIPSADISYAPYRVYLPLIMRAYP